MRRFQLREVCHSHLKNQLISPFLLIKILKSQLFFISLQKKKITYKNFHIDTNQNEGGNLLFV